MKRAGGRPSSQQAIKLAGHSAEISEGGRLFSKGKLDPVGRQKYYLLNGEHCFIHKSLSLPVTDIYSNRDAL